MFARFFIHRPVFALASRSVISLLGAVAVPNLPIGETPDITPPTVSVNGIWPGASALVIADNVAVPIEQHVNGVDDMLYLSSSSADDGTMAVTVTFEVGVDVDMATVLVQNRVAAAEPLLPEEAKRQGLTTRKQSTNMVSAQRRRPSASPGRRGMSSSDRLTAQDRLARAHQIGSLYNETNRPLCQRHCAVATPDRRALLSPSDVPIGRFGTCDPEALRDGCVLHYL